MHGRHKHQERREPKLHRQRYPSHGEAADFGNSAENDWSCHPADRCSRNDDTCRRCGRVRVGADDAVNEQTLPAPTSGERNDCPSQHGEAIATRNDKRTY